MQLAKVKGSIWATAKSQALAGYKLLVVEVDDNYKKKTLIAADSLESGIGETVLIIGGSSARVGSGSDDIPIDAMVIAIIDEKR